MSWFIWVIDMQDLKKIIVQISHIYRTSITHCPYCFTEISGKKKLITQVHLGFMYKIKVDHCPGCNKDFTTGIDECLNHIAASYNGVLN